MNEERKIHTPLITVLKRDDLKPWKALLIRAATFVITLMFAIFICYLIVKENYFKIFGTLFTGAFVQPWKLILDASMLLGFGIAIVPAFKMKYWNMGANGQVLVGALVSIVLMVYMKDFASKSTLNNIILLGIMLIASITASIIWAVIPAIFKVLFNTNETLFTLMMNYIAVVLVGYINYVLTGGKQDSLSIINQMTKEGWMPVVIDKYFIPIVVVIIMTVFMYIYMKKTKHGYEISVVGDSINTARYVGMNTKKIVIRTLALSGVLCGIIGFLYSSTINHSINGDTCGSLGFTAVLVAWLSNFNPFVMAGVAFIIAFITNGTTKITSVYHLQSNDLSSVIIGLIFFSILISEFFIKFRFKIRGIENLKKKKAGDEEC